MGSKVENDRAALQKTMKAIIEESKRKAAAQQPQLPDWTAPWPSRPLGSHKP
jgi:hypothetical protein